MFNRFSKSIALPLTLMVSLALASSGCETGGKKRSRTSSTTAVIASAAPIITEPGSSPHYLNAISHTIEGTCATNATITLSGAASQVALCAGGVFAFSVSPASEGANVYSVTQQEVGYLESAVATMVLVLDTTAPSVVSLTSPTGNPYASGDDSVVLGGGCEEGAEVTMTGAFVASTICESGAFSFPLDSTVDGAYNVDLIQTDIAGNPSVALPFTWTHDSAMPPTPTITLPSANPHYSNVTDLTISGGCTDGNTVHLGGASTQSTACASSTYSFAVSQLVDGTYNFTVNQESATHIFSGNASLSWTLDRLAPNAVTITQPVANPFASGDTTITIGGACETGTDVAISGALNSSTSCVAATYSFSSTKNVDATYNYSIVQTDAAGNPSAGTAFEWTRNTATPATPTITAPASTPIATHFDAMTIAGGCVDGHTVNLSGDVIAADVTAPAGSLSLVCASSAFSFTVQKLVDGPYALNVTQTNPINSLTSGPAGITWTRDTLTPDAPIILVPNTSPYWSSGNLTLSGSCETGATVNLSGDDTQAVACASSAFSFTVVKADGTYNFSVTQTDAAANTSGSDAVTWNRDSTIPATPTITTPATNPAYSNIVSPTFTVAGGCTSGYTVSLSGVLAGDVTSPAGSLTQACAGATYSFTLSKAVDGTYPLTVKQTNYALTDSAEASVTWIRDTVRPGDPSIDTKPASPSCGIPADFAFSSADGTATFQCAVTYVATPGTPAAPGSYAVCGANHTHTITAPALGANQKMFVKAIDPAGNESAAITSYQWTNTSYCTLALLHMENATDSSPYGASTLTVTGTITYDNVGSKFAMGEKIGNSTSYLRYNPVPAQFTKLNAPTSTFEAWANLDVAPTAGSYYAIMSRHASSGDYNWEMGIRNNAGAILFYFQGSSDGTTILEVTAPMASAADAQLLHHYAATYDNGVVSLFIDGVKKTTTGSLTGTSLRATTSSIRVGGSRKDGTAQRGFVGYVDEARISQKVRWTSTFTPATAIYSAD